MSTTHIDPIESLIRMLDAVEAQPDMIALRRRSYDLLDLPAGASVIDVGCGTGRAVGELAESGYQAIGVDANDTMVAAAHRRWPDADVRVGDAHSLPLADGEVAGYRADKVLHIFPEPARAIAEAARVLRPGGRIVLVGQDWDTIVIDSSDPALTRTIVHARADLVASPRVARAHRALLLDAGFADVTVEVVTSVFTDDSILPTLAGFAENTRASGAISDEQATAWRAEQEARALADRLFVAMPMFIASARRP